MPGYIIKQPNGLYCRYSTIVDGLTHYNMTKEEYLDYVAERARKDAEYDWEHGLLNHMTFDELKEKLIDYCPITKEEWEKYNGGEYTENDVEYNKEKRKEIYEIFEEMSNR